MTPGSGFVKAAASGDAPEIGIGLLGYSFMGRAHSNAYHKIPYIFWPPKALPRLVAICGRTEEKVAEAARRYGFEGYYLDWEEMIRDERIAVLDNSGPHALHVEPSIEALKAGKHVICEKPLALSAADARRMLEAARASGRKHMCGFNYRFIPAVRLARDLIQSGLLGRVYEFRCRYLQESAHDPTRPLRRVPTPETSRAGTLANLGCHIIDQARFLIGEPRTVSALLPTFERERLGPSGERVPMESDDAFVAAVEFESGAVGTLEGSRVATGRKNHLAWEVNGSEGSLAFDLERLNELQVYLAKGSVRDLAGFQDVLVTQADHPFVRVWWPGGHILGWEHAHVNEIQHFLESIALDREVGPEGATFEDGYRAAVVSEAIEDSAARGRRVEVSYA